MKESGRGESRAHARRAPLAGRALQPLALLALLALAGCSGGAWTVRVDDRSMEPTLAPRATVVVRPAASVERGDVVAFEYPFQYPGRPRRVLISRVIGLPGDTIEVRSGQVIRNGESLVEPYVRNRSDRSFPPVAVAPGHYYVLGDDRTNQRDSRYWGQLPADRLLGIVELGQR